MQIVGGSTTESVSKFIFLMPTHSDFTFLKYLTERIALNPVESDRLITEYESIRMYLLSVLLSPTSRSTSELIDSINAFRGLEGQTIFIPLHYPWDTEWRLFYLNDVFRNSVMAPETEHVFDKFKGPLHVHQVEEFGPNDIAIHIR